MKNEIIVTFEGNFIKVISNGEKNYEFALRLWSEVVSACRKNGCYKILGIAKTTRSVGTIEAYNHAQLFHDLGITQKYRIAWVELNPEAQETVDFIETVLWNRGLPGRVFFDILEAEKWLLYGSDA